MDTIKPESEIYQLTNTLWRRIDQTMYSLVFTSELGKISPKKDFEFTSDIRELFINHYESHISTIVINIGILFDPNPKTKSIVKLCNKIDSWNCKKNPPESLHPINLKNKRKIQNIFNDLKLEYYKKYQNYRDRVYAHHENLKPSQRKEFTTIPEINTHDFLSRCFSLICGIHYLLADNNDVGFTSKVFPNEKKLRNSTKQYIEYNIKLSKRLARKAKT